MKVSLPKVAPILCAMLFLCAIATFCSAQTQRKPDIIMLRGDSKLEVFIQEVDESVVKYKKLTDPEGPLFTVKKSEITSIKYGNGEVETFEAVLEVPSYYTPSSAQPNSVKPAAAPPRNGNKLMEEIRASPSDQLRATYKFYKAKSKGGLIMGIAGTSAGVLVAGIGTGILASATDANGNFATYADERRALRGAWMMIGGFAGATTFGTVGFIKFGKNGSKANRIRRELIHRGEPLAWRINPGFNPVTQSGYVRVSLNF
ncbi:hypothetical protein [Dyadobacter sp. CY323]|uniref:hypothetical protein n=1 Tax=Dyadobacter sp. CY323 TaxID=2907302 RepID=UPI001F261132|nr:hypothetical protein [Dyadobacter sp. CY323]MCE6990727.1 hypothetical protein [Dyadobacter sp. CY323]